MVAVKHSFRGEGGASRGACRKLSGLFFFLFERAFHRVERGALAEEVFRGSV